MNQFNVRLHLGCFPSYLPLLHISALSLRWSYSAVAYICFSDQPIHPESQEASFKPLGGTMKQHSH